MAIDPSHVGRTYPPTAPYEIGREKVREFAAAIRDTNPAYSDAAAAAKYGHADVVAPPTFPIVLTLLAGHQVITDPDIGIDYSRVVHGEQRFVYSRPLRIGDRLQVHVSIESIRTAAGNDMVGTRAEARTEDGELVVTAHSLIVVRGGGE